MGRHKHPAEGRAQLSVALVVAAALFALMGCSASTDVVVSATDQQPDTSAAEVLPQADASASLDGTADTDETVSSPAVSDSTPGAVPFDGPDTLIASEPVASYPVTLPDGTRSSSEMNIGGAGMWLAMQVSRDFTDSGLVQIDPTTGAVLQTVIVDRPFRMAVGNSAVWSDVRDGIVRVDAATGEITEFAGTWPAAIGDLVWINDESDVAVRIDPVTSEPVAMAGVTREVLIEAVPDNEVVANFPPDSPLPLRYVEPGPDAAWATLRLRDDVLMIEIDPLSGVARRATVVGEGREDVEVGEELEPVDGGVWFVASYEGPDLDDVVAVFFVPTGGTGPVVEIPVTGAEKYAPIVADENFVYLLPTEGPLIVLDVAAQQEVARIDNPEFEDNAYALTLADDAVWVAVQHDQVLVFRAAG